MGERKIDSFIHGGLPSVNLPFLFPRPGLRRHRGRTGARDGLLLAMSPAIMAAAE